MWADTPIYVDKFCPHLHLFLMIMKKLLTQTTIIALLYSANCHALSFDIIESVLEKYCIEHYDSCFKDRSYILKSIKVDSVQVDSVSKGIKVRGKHSYLGRYIPFFGRRTYSGVAFKAYISENGNSWIIDFFKLISPGDMLIQWEECNASVMKE